MLSAWCLVLLVSASAVLSVPTNFFPEDDNIQIESVSQMNRNMSASGHETVRSERQLDVDNKQKKDEQVSGSETEARGFIHDKLCSLGLCEGPQYGNQGYGPGPRPYPNAGYGQGPIPHHNGGFGHGGHVGGRIHAKDVTLVQPVAIKPVGPPISAIPLEPIKKPHHHHGGALGAGYERPGFGSGYVPHGPAPAGPYPSAPFRPVVPPFNPHHGKPQHFGKPHHHGHHHGHGHKLPPFVPAEPAYGLPGKVTTHVHHHVHHNEPLGPVFDGYPFAANKNSLAVAKPNGKEFGQFSERNPSEGNCLCVPKDQCYLEPLGSQNQAVLGGSGGVPNSGQLGFGIDPRNIKTSIESNATEIPEEANFNRTRRDVKGDGKAEPRQLDYVHNGQCLPGYMCCQQEFSSASNYPTSPVLGRIPNQCGKSSNSIDARVISAGSYSTGDTFFGEYPWQGALLKLDGSYVCGASLIDEQYIISAAHCVARLMSQELKVRLGEWDVNSETEYYPYVEKRVTDIKIHPQYYAGNLINDIAILRIEPVNFNTSPHINPVCLPASRAEFSGQRCFVSGWGKDSFGKQGQYQNVLKKVDLPVLEHYDCQNKLKQTRLGRDFVLNPGFVCAGGEDGKDSCKGDGGGPLVCEVHGGFQLAGVVSWGVGCGQRDVPGVYVKVSNYIDWIEGVRRGQF